MSEDPFCTYFSGLLVSIFMWIKFSSLFILLVKNQLLGQRLINIIKYSRFMFKNCLDGSLLLYTLKIVNSKSHNTFSFLQLLTKIPCKHKHLWKLFINDGWHQKFGQEMTPRGIPFLKLPSLSWFGRSGIESFLRKKRSKWTWKLLKTNFPTANFCLQ